VRTSSRINVPPDGARAGRTVTIAGVAFAGDRRISGVDVSTDGGQTWERAELKTALSPVTWRLWRFEWTPPKPGRYSVLVRAIDGDGQPQTAARAQPFPSGATGLDAIAVER